MITNILLKRKDINGSMGLNRVDSDPNPKIMDPDRTRIHKVQK